MTESPTSARRVSARQAARLMWGAGVAALAVACSFPEHTYIADSDFYDAGSGASSGQGGTTTGGTSGSGGSAGNGASGGLGGNAGTAGMAGSAGTGATAGTGGTAGTGAAGGAAGSGGAAGAGGNAGTAGSAGGTGDEDCTNGIDDDGDMKADCEDTKCQSVGYQCVALPQGWDGPVAVSEGATPPACQGNYPTTAVGAFKSLVAPPASCGACTCTTPAGVTCGVPHMILLDSVSCSGGTGWDIDFLNAQSMTLPPNTCANYNLDPGGTAPSPPISATSQAPPTTGGSCAPGGGTPTLPPTSWTTRMRGCGEPSGGTAATGCGANSCMPPASGQFNRGVCVYQQGDVACPGGSFSSKFVYNQGVDDQRSCSSCACGTPGGIDCQGDKLEVWNSAGCAGAAAGTINNPGDGSCVSISTSLTPGLKYSLGTASGGSCPTSGGLPTGGATANQPITFCCTL